MSYQDLEMSKRFQSLIMNAVNKNRKMDSDGDESPPVFKRKTREHDVIPIDTFNDATRLLQLKCKSIIFILS